VHLRASAFERLNAISSWKPEETLDSAPLVLIRADSRNGQRVSPSARSANDSARLSEMTRKFVPDADG
jgi:hypothetical protein